MIGLYGPPADQAWKAAEAIRSLNHATFAGTGYEWPSDVDAVIAGLETMAQRMPQGLRQAGQWLHRASEAGAIGHDEGAAELETVIAVLVSLESAAHLADQLARELAAMRSDTAHLTGRTVAPTTGFAP